MEKFCQDGREPEQKENAQSAVEGKHASERVEMFVGTMMIPRYINSMRGNCPPIQGSIFLRSIKIEILDQLEVGCDQVIIPTLTALYYNENS